MPPPIWLDEARRRLPTHPSWTCGRETSRFRLRATHLVRRPDWRPFQIERSVSWCGHSQAVIYLPRADGWWYEVPVWEPERLEGRARRWAPPERREAE